MISTSQHHRFNVWHVRTSRSEAALRQVIARSGVIWSPFNNLLFPVTTVKAEGLLLTPAGLPPLDGESLPRVLKRLVSVQGAEFHCGFRRGFVNPLRGGAGEKRKKKNAGPTTAAAVKLC